MVSDHILKYLSCIKEWASLVHKPAHCITFQAKVSEIKTKNSKSDVHDWPQVVSDTTKLQCAQSYHNATIWHPPAVCTVCSGGFSEGKHESFQIADTCTKLLFALEEL